jgi:glycosyltransferase 2 family protein
MVPETRLNMIKKIRTVSVVALGAAVIAACLAYLSMAVRGNWLSLSASLHHVRLPVFLCAIAVMFVSYLYEPQIWRRIVRRLGFPLSRIDATAIYYLSCLAIYLPVKIVDLVGRVLLLKKAGATVETGGTSLFLELWFSLTASVMIALYFPLARIPGRCCAIAPYWTLAWALAAACAALLSIVTLRAGAGLLRRFLSTSPSLLHTVSAADAVGILTRYVVVRLIGGAAFYLVIGSIVQFKSIHFYDAIAVQCLAWILSLPVFFVPKGLVVREALIVSIFGPQVGAAPALTAVLLYRLCTIVLDLLLGLWGLSVTGRKRLTMAKKQE